MLCSATGTSQSSLRSLWRLVLFWFTLDGSCTLFGRGPGELPHGVIVTLLKQRVARHNAFLWSMEKGFPMRCGKEDQMVRKFPLMSRSGPAGVRPRCGGQGLWTGPPSRIIHVTRDPMPAPTIYLAPKGEKYHTDPDCFVFRSPPKAFEKCCHCIRKDQ